VGKASVRLPLHLFVWDLLMWTCRLGCLLLEWFLLVVPRLATFSLVLVLAKAANELAGPRHHPFSLTSYLLPYLYDDQLAHCMIIQFVHSFVIST